MRLERLVLAAAIAITIIAATTQQATAAPGDAAAAEVTRIRVHFDSVLASLGSRDVAGLEVEQRARRAVLLETLRAYQARGVFPHNYDFPGQAVPYFVDRKTGTLCAVAHLLASTGRRDIVDRVARADNNVLVPQLAGDSVFTRWLDDNGLTLNEAAFIQMPYMQPVSQAEVARNVGFAVAAPFALGGAMATSLWNATSNADGHSSRISKIGIISGLATVGLGATVLSKSEFNHGIAASGVVMGVTSVALSMRSMHNHTGIMAQREAEKARTMAQTAVVPMVDMSNGGSAGIAVSVRF
ncbi:MAG: hypothetical protein JWL61_1182 [Gemmatimonadetes bacterium]|nr:hypothetical protein [Gemmatimonadota bacterium]